MVSNRLGSIRPLALLAWETKIILAYQSKSLINFIAVPVSGIE